MCACRSAEAGINDTLVFERLFLAAFAVLARIQTVLADKGYDAEHHRKLCRQFGAEPHIHKLTSTSAASRTDPVGHAALAGRALQRLGPGEQAPHPTL